VFPENLPLHEGGWALTVVSFDLQNVNEKDAKLRHEIERHQVERVCCVLLTAL
jgi:hypothetical protein